MGQRYDFRKRLMRFKDLRAYPNQATKTEYIMAPARWTTDDDLVRRRTRRWKDRHEWYDTTSREFGLSRGYVVMDRDLDATWEVHRVQAKAHCKMTDRCFHV